MAAAFTTLMGTVPVAIGHGFRNHAVTAYHGGYAMDGGMNGGMHGGGMAEFHGGGAVHR